MITLGGPAPRNFLVIEIDLIVYCNTLFPLLCCCCWGYRLATRQQKIVLIIIHVNYFYCTLSTAFGQRSATKDIGDSVICVPVNVETTGAMKVGRWGEFQPPCSTS